MPDLNGSTVSLPCPLLGFAGRRISRAPVSYSLAGAFLIHRHSSLGLALIRAFAPNEAQGASPVGPRCHT